MPNKDTFLAIYDLEITPCAYDAIHYIGLMMPVFESSRCSNLTIIFVPWSKTRADTGYSTRYDLENARWRFRQIVQSAFSAFCPATSIQILGSREELKQILAHSNAVLYPPDYSIENPTTIYSNAHMMRDPKPVLGSIIVADQALQFIREWKSKLFPEKKIVTITLRESSYTVERNSSLDDWIAFAKSLKSKAPEYEPVFIPDTEKALIQDSRLNSFSHLPQAAFNIEIRAALYQESYINLSINNGPASLCYVNKKTRYLYFKPISEGKNPASLEHWTTHYEYYPGRHWPCNNELQLTIWEDDRRETIEKAFELLATRIEGKALPSLDTLIRKSQTALTSNAIHDAWDWSAIAVAFYHDSPDTWFNRIDTLERTGRGEEAFYQAKEALTRFDDIRTARHRLENCKEVTHAPALQSFYRELIEAHPEIEGDIRDKIRQELSFPIDAKPSFNDKWSFEERSSKDIIIFGASTGGNRCKERLVTSENVLAFCDNDRNKWGEKHKGVLIISPGDLESKLFDEIWIASEYALAIYKQLIAMGIPIKRLRIIPLDLIAVD